MKSFRSFLIEDRPIPHTNGIVNDILKKYASDPNIFISFTSLDKIGINPHSTFTITPNGIYTYPLKEVFQNGKLNVDFGIERRFLFILKSKCNNILRITKYTKTDLDNDLAKLDVSDEILSDALGMEHSKEFPAMYLYNILKLLSGNQFKWASLYRKLGYCALYDDAKIGLMLGIQPVMAVFFDKKSVSVVEKLINSTKKIVIKSDTDLVSNLDKLYLYKNGNKVHYIQKYYRKKPSQQKDIIEVGKKYQNVKWFESEHNLKMVLQNAKKMNVINIFELIEKMTISDAMYSFLKDKISKYSKTERDMILQKVQLK
jgi:hypothetical protein